MLRRKAFARGADDPHERATLRILVDVTVGRCAAWCFAAFVAAFTGIKSIAGVLGAGAISFRAGIRLVSGRDRIFQIVRISGNLNRWVVFDFRLNRHKWLLTRYFRPAAIWAAGGFAEALAIANLGRDR